MKTEIEAATAELEGVLAEPSLQSGTDRYYNILEQVCDGERFETWRLGQRASGKICFIVFPCFGILNP